MKLKTIWTLRPMPLRERISRTGETLWRIAAHRLPRKLAYWSYIDSGVRHTHPDEVVTEVRYMDLLARLSGGPQ